MKYKSGIKKSIKESTVTDYSDLEATITNYGNNVDISDEVRGKTYNRVRISADLYYDKSGKLVDPDSIPTGEFDESKKCESDLKKSIKNKMTKKECDDPKKIDEGALSEFTKSDWYAYAGADRFEDGSSPLIHETEDFTVVVSGDPDGGAIVEVDITTPETYTKVFGSKKEAVDTAESLIDDMYNGNAKPFDPTWSTFGY